MKRINFFLFIFISLTLSKVFAGEELSTHEEEEIILQDPMLPKQLGDLDKNSWEYFNNHFHLRVILYNNEFRNCIINDVWLSEGDQLDGYVVARITQNRVIMLNKEAKGYYLVIN